jgi:ribonuclease BN (tRNA processing enzyme)
MKIKILGCSGGIGSGRHTTCLMVDDDILIDAGSGITTLSLEQLEAVEHVFITHAHLDHVLGLPLLLDSVGDRRGRPVDGARPARGAGGAVGTSVQLASVAGFFAPSPASIRPGCSSRRCRSVPRWSWTGGLSQLCRSSMSCRPCGLRISTASGSLAFSGDTTSSDALVDALNAIPDLRHLIIETSFENELVEIAKVSMHHWPDSLAAELKRLSVQARSLDHPSQAGQ